MPRPRPEQAGAQGGPAITGGGSSFADLEISQWKSDIAKPPYGLSVNYSRAGSTFGRQKYLTGALDFGVSDIQFQPDEQPAVAASPRKNFVYVPVSAGALAFMFNVIGTDGNRITNLRLTQSDACRLFTEPGITWNDPSIQASNPGVALPPTGVRPVVRSDGSGTSFVLSEFCIATAPDVWGRFVGLITSKFSAQGNLDFNAGRPTSNWPVGWGSVAPAFASDGVAGVVGDDGPAGQNTVTYVETGYTVIERRPAALVRNAAGVFTPPEPANSTVALGYANGLPDGTFRLSYTGPDPRAYFPSTYSYAIAQTSGFDPAKGRVLATFLNYAVTKGQQGVEPVLRYSRLSVVLVNLALDKITQIPGAPPRPTDLFGAPPPPTVLGGGGTPPPSSSAQAQAQAAAKAAAAAQAAKAAQAAAGTGSPEAAAAQAAADQAAAAAASSQTADGYQLKIPKGGAEQLASSAGSGPGKRETGPGNREVFFTLLTGAALVAFSSFVARGTRSSWQGR